MAALSAEDTRAVRTFLAFLNVRTDHPKPDYVACARLLQSFGELYGLEHSSFEVASLCTCLLEVNSRSMLPESR